MKILYKFKKAEIDYSFYIYLCDLWDSLRGRCLPDYISLYTDNSVHGPHFVNIYYNSPGINHYRLCLTKEQADFIFNTFTELGRRKTNFNSDLHDILNG